ncbi:MAG: hypothetical protein MJK04_35065, partial [Psychrosphaera sp.]|nr:hypothetical protein [Psychrosphaera sp.]
MSLFINDGQSEVTGRLNYAVNLFECASAKRFIAQYQQVLKAMVANEHQTNNQKTNNQQTIAQIDLLTPTERETLLCLNQTNAAVNTDKTLHQLFEQQVQRTPQRTVLIFKEEQLSYAGLNQKANQLAHAILARADLARADFSVEEGTKQPLKPDTLVALYLDRSFEMVISILAVLKAGGAYVPIS